ncbi:hypothetical protein BC830DRAFT_1132016 [Chytriomyces sp. MP71]|nr:hypothetical protein BC830DRAFT_1132016 [Chytriomyces sp. MP71]
MRDFFAVQRVHLRAVACTQGKWKQTQPCCRFIVKQAFAGSGEGANETIIVLKAKPPHDKHERLFLKSKQNMSFFFKQFVTERI